MPHHEISEHWGQRKDLKAFTQKIKITTEDHKTRQCMASITTQNPRYVTKFYQIKYFQVV